MILDALRARDEERAVELIEDHLRGSYERVIGPMHEPRAGRGGIDRCANSMARDAVR